MPTLDDLLAAFDELERQAPEALSEPVRPTHRRRWAAVGLAAACTAAVAVAVPLVTNAGDATQPTAGSEAPTTRLTILPAEPMSVLAPPADGQSPDLTYRFAIPGTVAGYTVIPDQVTRTYQHASVYGPTEPPGGQVFVYYRGTFDPRQLDRGDPVEVAGGPGYYSDVTLPGTDHPVAALAWQYAADAWALVRLGVDTVGEPSAKGAQSKAARARAAAQAAQARARNARSALQARSNELLLAQALTSAHDPLTSPVRIPDGPGLHVDSMSSGGPDGGLDLADGDGPAWHLGWSPDALRASDKPNAGTVSIGSHEWIVYTSGGVPASLGLVADGWGMTVTPEGTASLDQMKQFVAQLGIAPVPSNENTWFDAEDNLP